MNERERRSWLLVPASKPEGCAAAATSGADVIVIDLVELVAERDKHRAREYVSEAIAAVRASGADAFVMIDPTLAYADLAASVGPTLSGVVVSRAETPEQIAAVSSLLDELEAKRGVLPGTIHIVPALETALGNHNGYEIARASTRVAALTLGRVDLVMDLRPEPCGEIHMLPYLMQRLIIVANAAAVIPLGAWWRRPDRGLLATPQATYQAALRGRSIGFRGAVCLRVDQVDALNRAYARSASC